MTLTNGKPGENRACRFRHVKSPSDKVAFNASHKLEKFRTAICTIRTRSEQAPAVEPRVAQIASREHFWVCEVLASKSQGQAHGTSSSDASRIRSSLPAATFPARGPNRGHLAPARRSRGCRLRIRGHGRSAPRHASCRLFGEFTRVRALGGGRPRPHAMPMTRPGLQAPLRARPQANRRSRGAAGILPSTEDARDPPAWTGRDTDDRPASAGTHGPCAAFAAER